MSFWNIIKGLNYRQIISLIGWFFQHPLYMISTVSATLQTFRISQKEFPNIHGKLNKANAFRHALWNILIAKKCAKFSNNTKSIIGWAKKITDWHEEFSPNEELAEAMDFHNNKIGRDMYEDLGEESIHKIVSILKESLEKAMKVNLASDIKKYPTQMVYIED